MPDEQPTLTDGTVTLRAWRDDDVAEAVAGHDDEIVVAGHFSDYTGKYVVHCHMLDHEDHGLMSQFEVVDRP